MCNRNYQCSTTINKISNSDQEQKWLPVLYIQKITAEREYSKTKDRDG